jgi:hypothetical protein
MTEDEQEVEANCTFTGTLNVCLGRNESLYSLTGCEGFAISISDEMALFLVDGYSYGDESHTYRVRKENLSFK